MKEAIFAGGCFWCMQPVFDRIEGVRGTEVGFAGGSEQQPSYKEVASGMTSHREVIRVSYDPELVSYGDLLDAFWKSIDPTQEDGQFADRGEHYQTAIFYKDELAELSKRDLEQSGKFSAPVVTEILPATEYYPAEEEHQAYYRKNAAHYNAYKVGSGRAGFIKKIWGEE